jgi:short-subunit dehydrogenase
VITGASTGIGRALAAAWTERAARLVLNARSVEKLEEVAASCRVRGADAIVVPGDIRDPSVQAALVEGATAQFGAIDVLVNNAGVGLYGAVAAIDPATLREVFELNVIAPMTLTQRALPALEEARGAVVMMSSIAGVVPMPRSGGYAATKFALEAISMALRAELSISHPNIRVCVIRPGVTATEFTENARIAEGGPRPSIRGVGEMSAEEVARRTVDAVDAGDAELDLTLAARAIGTLSRINRPALRAVLSRMATRLGVQPRRE